MEHPQLHFAAFYSAIAGEVVVRSDHAIWIRTRAPDFNEAWQRVEEQIPFIVAALSKYSEAPPRVQLLRIAETQKTGAFSNVMTPWAPSGTFRGYPVHPLSEAEVTEVPSRYAVGRGRAEAACRLYYEATRQQDQMDGTPRSFANVVSTYFQVVEEVANRVLATYDLPVEQESDARNLLESLRSTLSSGRPLKKKLTALRATSLAVSRLEQRFLNQRVELAGADLGVDPACVVEARRLADLRSTALSHPGRPLPDDLSAHLNVAERVARTYLNQWLDSLL